MTIKQTIVSETHHIVVTALAECARTSLVVAMFAGFGLAGEHAESGAHKDNFGAALVAEVQKEQAEHYAMVTQVRGELLALK